MKKETIIYILTVIAIILISIFLSSGYKKSTEPRTYYEVYLDGKVIGAINSKEELENYIDKQNDKYKNQFGVDRVYSPKGLSIEKVLTYSSQISSVASIYAKIQNEKPFIIFDDLFALLDEDNLTRIESVEYNGQQSYNLTYSKKNQMYPEFYIVQTDKNGNIIEVLESR